MTLRERAAKAVLWSSVQHWGGHAISFVIFVFLARLLPVKAFGLVALANVFVAFVQSVAGQGFSSALVQREELEREHLDSAFWASFAAGSACTLLGVVSGPYIARGFGDPELSSVVQALAVLFLLHPLQNIPEAMLRRQLRFRIVATRRIVSIVASGVLAICLAQLGFGAWSLVAHQLVGQTISVFILWSACEWRPRLRFSWRAYRELLPHGANVTGFAFLNFFYRRGDDFLIGYFLGPLALGYYNVAYRVLRLLNQAFIGTIGQVAFPVFSRLQVDRERFGRVFLEATELVVLAALPVFAGVGVLAPTLVPYVFGEHWSAAAPAMRVLACAGVINAISFGNYSAMVALGKPGWRLRLHLCKTILFFVSAAVVAKQGIVAVASTLVAVSLLGYPFELVLVHRLVGFRFRDYFGRLVVPAAGGVAVGVVVALLQAQLAVSPPAATLSICGMAGGTAYLVTVVMLAPALPRRVFGYIQEALFRRSGRQVVPQGGEEP